MALRGLCAAILLFSSIALAISCASEPAPEAGKAPLWVSNLPETYPEQDWLCAVEYSSDKKSAETAALIRLSQTFRMDVQAVSRSSEFLGSLSQSGTKNSSESIQIRQIENELSAATEIRGLIGVQRESWTDKNNNTVYALARMNRAECSARYRSLIAENEKLIKNLTEDAKRQNPTFEAYEKLIAAAGVAELSDALYGILSVLDTRSESFAPAYGNARAVKELLRSEAGSIVIKIDIQGDSDSRLTKAFEQIFSGYGFRTGTVNQGNVYSLKGNFKTENSDSGSLKFTSFDLSVSLSDKNGVTLFPYTETGREGHINQSGARQRAISTVENRIAEEFAQKFNAWLGSLL
jgi:hypothetical protein